MSEIDKQGFLFKLIIVGEQAVGKSSLLQQYTNNSFKSEYNVTIGVEFASKTIQLEQSQLPITIQIWDTAGQESFKSIVKSFYRQAAAAFLVYNVNKRDTFLALDDWLKEIKENSHNDIIIFVIGNQVDKENRRQVSYDEGQSYIKQRGCDFFYETSAKTGQNVEQAFQEITRLVYQKFIQNKITQGPNASQDNDQLVRQSQSSSKQIINPDKQSIESPISLKPRDQQQTFQEKKKKKSCC